MLVIVPTKWQLWHPGGDAGCDGCPQKGVEVVLVTKVQNK